MKNRKRLKGRRVAVLVADGFEKVELTVPVKALKATKADVEIVSLRHGRIRGVNLHEPASRIHVDITVFDADPADYDALLVPGGLMNPDLLRQSFEAREFVRQFDLLNKPIATICHGPWVLASAGLLNGRIMTSWPGIRDDVVNAGATWLDEEVVRDGNLVTSRGPQDLDAFVPEMIDLFAQDQPQFRDKTRTAVSAPQRNEPPDTVVQTMRWMPRPSLRTALILGCVGIAVAMMRKNRVTTTDRTDRVGEIIITEEIIEPVPFTRATAVPAVPTTVIVDRPDDRAY